MVFGNVFAHGRSHFAPLEKKLKHRHIVELDARFSPTWSGNAATPPATTAVVPNTPVPPEPTSPAPVPPATTPEQDSSITHTSTTVVVVTTVGTPPPIDTSKTTALTSTPSLPATSSTTPLTSTTSSTLSFIVPSSSSTPPVVVVTALPPTSTPTSAPPATFLSLPMGTGGAVPTTHSTVSASAASQSASNDSSALSTGSIAGIVAASLVAIGVIVTVVLYFIRRHSHEEEENSFSRRDFMRQSVAINDEPTYPNMSQQPRPPSMFERRAGAAGVGAHGFNPNQNNNNSSNQHDQYMMPPPLPPTANPFSPSASPMSPDYPQYEGAPHIEMVQHSVQPLTRTPSSPYGQQEHRQGAEEEEYAEEPNYLEMSRASVTPYQAAQYAEIQRRLNAPALVPPVPSMPASNYTASEGDMHEDELRPPGAMHQRIDSNPPVLPDLPRAFSPVNVGPYAFPMPGAPGAPPRSVLASNERAASPANSNGNGNGSAKGLAPPSAYHKPRVVSVPESAYAPETPSATEHEHGQHATPNDGGKGRPETMYNEEDIYGGI
ncbi:hypothetical protein SISSUDRAFT_1059234 [Sistotremastrum suecicum HHB10207 ss-3]|uniref:Uncharacterized protein n=1 Tax=Sistotremastrum suecicum HHB10207 ss-3 TaxID=1314776 RepID=A0A166GIP2_9AGAM|nr:hypothetical protein SISSUDRAFT_1059234 [Sistotremastrum suecicum HHB10207 ss-3]